jgi:hypothetical protein
MYLQQKPNETVGRAKEGNDILKNVWIVVVGVRIILKFESFLVSTLDKGRTECWCQDRG